MDERLDPDEARHILRNVAAYRHLCEHVRKKATWGLLFGAVMFGLWYTAFGQRNNYGLFSLIYLGLASLEFSAGLLNKIRPSAEGVLVDGFVLFGFGAANLGRAYLGWQMGLPPNSYFFYVLLGGYWIFAGTSSVRSYASLRRAFSFRPSAEHMRWFGDLVREIRVADPENDPTALDLPTKPPLRGKLLGDMAIFLPAGSADVVVASRRDVEIEREESRNPDRPPVGFLLIEGADFGGFPIDPVNWQNYARWKTEGGQPPSPVRLRPAAADIE